MNAEHPQQPDTPPPAAPSPPAGHDPHGHATPQGPTPETVERGHELDHVAAGGVLTIGAILTAVVVGSLVFLTFLEGALQDREAPKQEEAPTTWRRAERPAVDFDQPAQLAALREWERSTLAGYGWQDEQKTVARIPVERAMEVLLEQGFPLESATLPGAKGPPSEVEPRRDPAAAEESAGPALPNTEAETDKQAAPANKAAGSDEEPPSAAPQEAPKKQAAEAPAEEPAELEPATQPQEPSEKQPPAPEEEAPAEKSPPEKQATDDAPAPNSSEPGDAPETSAPSDTTNATDPPAVSPEAGEPPADSPSPPEPPSEETDRE